MRMSPWIPEKDLLTQVILGKLLEELGELTAITSRCLIQGINESEPKTFKLNKIALTEEIADVQAGIEMALTRLKLDNKLFYDRVNLKIIHLQDWHEQIIK